MVKPAGQQLQLVPRQPRARGRVCAHGEHECASVDHTPLGPGSTVRLASFSCDLAAECASVWRCDGRGFGFRRGLVCGLGFVLFELGEPVEPGGECTSSGCRAVSWLRVGGRRGRWWRR